MNGRDFLLVIDRLRTEDDEPFRRNAIGRAYYAAFLEARSFCEAHLGYSNARTAHEHRDVRILIQQHAPDLDDKLFFLRRYRNIADYELQVDPETIAANDQHAEFLARQVIAGLDALAASLQVSPEPSVAGDPVSPGESPSRS